MDDDAVIQNEQVTVLQPILCRKTTGFMQLRVCRAKVAVHDAGNAGCFLCGPLNIQIHFEFGNAGLNNIKRTSMTGFTGTHTCLQQFYFVSVF